MTSASMRTSAESKALISLASSPSLDSAIKAVEVLVASHGYRWVAVGHEGNFGQISIGSDSGDALVERITNAIDAVIECEAARSSRSKRKSGPSTPREAVETWFKVPGGRVGNIKDNAFRQSLANRISIELLDGVSKNRPNIRIRDLGIGLTPVQVPTSILSLGANNKIDKPYLAGAYGQGGSTTLAFSPEGTLFLSRRQPDLRDAASEDLIAVTFARYEELDPESNKNGRYAYLVDKHGRVAGVAASLIKDFEPGTQVMHFNYQFDKYCQMMTQPVGSLWWLLHNVMFDPVLPIWAIDSRISTIKGDGKSLRRTIAGNNARLTREDNENVEHQDSLGINVPHPEGEAHLRVNYWVIKPRTADGNASPTDSYVDPYQPVTYTYNGQRHGTEDRRFITNRLNLSYLAKYLVIQVELDGLHGKARREVLSSTRDRLKQTKFLDQIREAVAEAMSEDESLIRLNDLRKEELLSRHSQKDREKIRQRFADLMKKLPAGTDAKIPSKGSGEDGGRVPSGSSSREPLAPLPTKSRPTFIRIGNASLTILVQVDRRALVRLESDAPDAYLDNHAHARLTLAPQPDGALKLESHSDFRGGRSRLTMRVAEGIKPGTEGTLTVFLLTPEGQSLTASAKYRVVDAKTVDTAGHDRKSEVKTPEPIPVQQSEWGQHGWSERSVATVASGDDPKIFVNIDNMHLRALLRNGGYQETGISRMKDNFLLYVAFFAWSREMSMALNGQPLGDSEHFEAYQVTEMDRLAQTIVYSISSAARTAQEGA